MRHRIAIIRNRAGLTQEAFADLTGVSLRQIQTWEQKGTFAGLAKLGKIADALAINPAVLISEQAEIALAAAENPAF